MIQTSEYCAVGHPDRTCDAIASYILDRYLEKDRQSRVALEVQLKDNYCTVSGEVTSEAAYTEEELSRFVREAIDKIGYTKEYQEEWGKENIICGEDVKVVLHISQQSSDIAQGVNAAGWGDQGIFWGMAEGDGSVDKMPMDYYLARKIGQKLVYWKMGGLDIKTMVTVEDGKVLECVVAIPLKDDADQTEIEKMIRKYVGTECPIIINGTGRYVKHGSVGDCGTTGRKLVVDFYGGNCRIGGGSPWGKDPSKADVTLNIYARMKALEYLKEHKGHTRIYCSISCCIGKKDIRISYYDGRNNLISTEIESKMPDAVIEELGLRLPCYFERCCEGLFGYEYER